MIKLRPQSLYISLLDITQVLSILELAETLCHTAKCNHDKINFIFVGTSSATFCDIAGYGS